MDDEGLWEEEEVLVISDDTFENGNPIIKGTRITVESLLREFAKGKSAQQILEEHPELTKKTFRAAMQFAIESVRFDHVNPR